MDVEWCIIVLVMTKSNFKVRITEIHITPSRNQFEQPRKGHLSANEWYWSKGSLLEKDEI